MTTHDHNALAERDRRSREKERKKIAVRLYEASQVGFALYEAGKWHKPHRRCLTRLLQYIRGEKK